MISHSRTDFIRARLQQAFSPTHLDVVDESDQHIGHAGYQGGGRHFAIKIAAACFKDLSRVEAHRKIYALFDDMIPHTIHALKISIISD
jgi:BolA family transcriptional regulator, general stress-responsive regulator